MSAQVEPEISRETVDQSTGPLVLEFGAAWCGYCQAAQNVIVPGLAQFPDIRHIKIEDGKGRKPGRSYKVKLWPTLIFIRDGVERERLVRDINAQALKAALQLIAAD